MRNSHRFLQLACILTIAFAQGVFAQTVRYVWTNSPSPGAPFTDWDTAAHTIQEAVDACAAGDLVLVTNGLYDTGFRAMPGYTARCRVVITNNIRVTSVNGPQETVIRGEGPAGAAAVRCAYLSGGALLSGFTLTNGCTPLSGWQYFDGAGGGAFIRQNGTVSNCVITGGDVWRYGGGIMCSEGGLVVDSIIAGNCATNYGASGGGLFLYYGGSARSCLIEGNRAYWNGGGVDISYTGTVSRCEIRGNTSIGGDGGGVETYYGGSVSHCLIYGNRAGGTTEYDGGGGVSCFFGGYVTNCAIYGNSTASQGGGARGTFGGALVNCTIFDNEAAAGGGVYGNYYLTNFNNIIYHNRALLGPNFATNGGGNVFAANCVTPLAEGAGNFTNAPLLAGVGNWHLLSNSPCINAGSNSFAAGIVSDLDGESRIMGPAVDVGCDEVNPAAFTGSISAAIRAQYTRTVANIPLTFYSDASGKVSRTEWRIATDSGTRVTTNAFSEQQAWSVPGNYDVVLNAFNSDASASATVTVEVVSGFTNFVAQGGMPVPPFTDWASAATSLYDAVQALPPGGVTLVSNGLFAEERAISIDKPCEIRGVNGPGVTTVSGRGVHRVLHINQQDVRVHDLAIVDGFETASGGGVRMDAAGVLSNCWVARCNSGNNGGGVYLSSGASLINCVVISNRSTSSGAGAYFDMGGFAQGCRFEYNQSDFYGGGAYFNRGGSADDSLFLGNISDDGGGGAYCNYGGSMRNGQYLDNEAYNGGGIYLNYGGTALNPHVAGNFAEYSGGGVYLYGSTHGYCINATIQGNTAAVRGGGIFVSSGGRVRNSIIYYNTAAQGANFYNDWSGFFYDTCCMTPAPVSGAANIMTNAPLFPGALNPHLMSNSPCINAGSNLLASGIALDVDGEARTNGVAVDIGCDEYWASGMTGTLSVAILATYTTAVAGTPLTFDADVRGRAGTILWQINDAGTTNFFSDLLSVTYAWPALGSYDVILSAFNGGGSASATVTVTLVNSQTNYVDLANPSPAAPYMDWTSAANGIQEAVDAAPAGGVVLVSNGVYNLPATVVVSKPVRIESVNGPGSVAVSGSGIYRCFQINSPAVTLSGLKVRNGYAADNGGGIHCGTGTLITNCVIENCRADSSGGGVYFNAGGTICNSRLEFNQAATYGGGIYCSVGGQAQACSFYSNQTTSTGSGGGGAAYVNIAGTFVDCVFTNNRAAYRGGAGLGYYGGVFSNCIFEGNSVKGSSSSIAGGAVYLTYGGTLAGCVVNNNSSDEIGGGVLLYYGGTIQNCVVSSNRTDESGGGVYVNSSGNIRGSRIERNESKWRTGGGVFLYRGGMVDNCDVVSNRASFSPGGGVYVDRGSVSGASVTNCRVEGNYGSEGGGVYISSYGNVIDSSLSRNQSLWNGGGASLSGGGRLIRCAISGNSAEMGGGVYLTDAGAVSNCLITGNSALEGGGAYALFGGGIFNSYLGGNIATNRGGGVCLEPWGEAARVTHCTIVGNTCYGQGGGAWASVGASLCNSILYDNLAVFGHNWFNDGATPPTYDHCCITPDPGGAGNITGRPMLAGLGNPHLLTNSPCINAGDNAWAAGEDIDREPRIAGVSVDIGCDEVDGTNVAGAITAAIIASATNAVVQTSLEFMSGVQGPVTDIRWTLDTGSGFSEHTNEPAVVQSWSAPGDYAVVLEAWNLSGSAAATVTVHVTEAQTNYVSPGGAHVWPFATWANASTSITEAVAAAAYGGVVLVSNGVYREAPAVFVDKALTIRSVNGWRHTTMDGQGQYRCFFLLDTNVLIEGFTFSNAMARADVFGGGGAVVLNEGGTVRNCRFINCSAAQYGGGVVCYYGGSVQNCWFTGNTAMFGGGVLCYYGGSVVNSTFVGNRAFVQGGGVYCEGGGTVRNSIMYYNHGAMGANWLGVGGGISFENNCTAPLPEGPGNFTNAPAMAGINNAHLLTNSPCIGAGSNLLASGIEFDMDGEARILYGRVDAGCDEFSPPGLVGPLFAAVAAQSLRTAPGSALDFWAIVEGMASRTQWTVDTGAGLRSVTNSMQLQQSWPAAGSYNVILTAFNNSGSASATVTVTVADATVHYVAQGGADIPPYTNWSEAATSVTSALAVASAGDTVIITDGVYVAGAELIIDRPLRVLSVNGPGSTVVAGANAYRIFRLDHPGAELSGLGITKGNSATSPGGEGGGVVFNGGGTMINCHVYSNTAPNYGGGVLLYGGGVVSNCVIRHNNAQEGGGAQLFNGGVLKDSIIRGNESVMRGGGVGLTFDGLVSNCTIEANECNSEGGGVSFYEGGTCADSLIAANTAGDGGGVNFYVNGTLLNCMVASNLSWSMGGGARAYKGGLIRNCLFHANEANIDWGMGRGGGIYLRLGGTVENCTVVGNIAPAGGGGGVLCNAGGTVANTIIYSNTGGNVSSPEQGSFIYTCSDPLLAGTANFTNEPLFADWSTENFRLATNSPCAEQGINQPWMAGAVDLDGTARLKNPYVDVGAYESNWTNIDTDADGLLVDVERQQFGTSDLTSDTDGDRQNDFDEGLITGTSPTNSSEYFHGIISNRTAAGAMVVYWPSITNRIYRLDTVVGLDTGAWTGVPGWTNVEGVAGYMYYTNTYTDTWRSFRPTVTRTNW